MANLKPAAPRRGLQRAAFATNSGGTLVPTMDRVFENMAVLKKGYRALELLVQLNLDRVLVGLALGGALYLAAYLSTL
jgi:hypothetical protein